MAGGVGGTELHTSRRASGEGNNKSTINNTHNLATSLNNVTNAADGTPANASNATTSKQNPGTSGACGSNYISSEMNVGSIPSISLSKYNALSNNKGDTKSGQVLVTYLGNNEVKLEPSHTHN